MERYDLRFPKCPLYHYRSRISPITILHRKLHVGPVIKATFRLYRKASGFVHETFWLKRKHFVLSLGVSFAQTTLEIFHVLVVCIFNHYRTENCHDWQFTLQYERCSETNPAHRAPLRRADHRTTRSW